MAKKNSIHQSIENLTSEEVRTKHMNFNFEGIPSTVHVHYLQSGPLTIVMDVHPPKEEGGESVIEYPTDERRDRITEALKGSGLI